MMTCKQPPRVPPLLLEKLALGLETATEKAQIRAHYSEEEQQTIIRDIQKSDAEMRKRFPVRDFDKLCDERQKRRVPTLWLQSLSAVAACFLVFTFWNRSDSISNVGDILLKGSTPHIAVYRELANGYERLKPNVLGHRGETMQLRYVAAGYEFGAVLSIDGTGKITKHLPVEKSAAVKLKQTGEVALPYAFELDAAPDYERFVYVVAHEPFSTESIETSLHNLYLAGNAKTGNVVIPANGVQYSFVVRK